MTILTHTIEVPAFTFGTGPTARTWSGQFDFTRDDATQVVNVVITATKIAGPGNGSNYLSVEGIPPIPVEFRPEHEEYPYDESGWFACTLFQSGLVNLYVGGAVDLALTWRYLTLDPAVVPEPEPEPEPVAPTPAPGIDAEFGDWMETISVEPFGGDGAWSEGFGESVAILAHWQYENRVVITSDGKSVNSSTQIQCGTQYAEALNEGARVTLPGDFREYRVASVRTWPGDDSHLEVGLV